MPCAIETRYSRIRVCIFAKGASVISELEGFVNTTPYEHNRITVKTDFPGSRTHGCMNALLYGDYSILGITTASVARLGVTHSLSKQ